MAANWQRRNSCLKEFPGGALYQVVKGACAAILLADSEEGADDEFRRFDLRRDGAPRGCERCAAPLGATLSSGRRDPRAVN